MFVNMYIYVCLVCAMFFMYICEYILIFVLMCVCISIIYNLATIIYLSVCIVACFWIQNTLMSISLLFCYEQGRLSN